MRSASVSALQVVRLVGVNADCFADGFAAGSAAAFADGDGDVRVRPVAPRRAATAGAAAAAGRAAPRSRAAELAFTNVKAYFTTCLFVHAMLGNLGNPSTGRT